MEIKKFQKTNSIPLTQIQKEFPDFRIPQMYIYLDNSPLLEYIESRLVIEGEAIENTFDNITSGIICRN